MTMTDAQQRQQDRSLAGEFAEYAAKKTKRSIYSDYGTVAAAVLGEIAMRGLLDAEGRSAIAVLTSIAIMGVGIATSRWERQRLRHEFDQANDMLGPDARRDLRPIEEVLPKNTPLDLKQEMDPRRPENILMYGLAAVFLVISGPLSGLTMMAVGLLLKEKDVHQKTRAVAQRIAANAPGPVGPA